MAGVSTTNLFASRAGASVAAAAASLRRALGLAPAAPLAFMRQVHGSRVVDVTGEQDELGEIPDCDGLVTSSPGAALVVRTADCVPVVLCDSTRPFLAALHAGWRGTLLGIVPEAIRLALGGGSRPQDLHVLIGPRICQRHYEVSPDLAAEFMRLHGDLGGFLDGRHLDLGLLNRLQAMALGVPATQVRELGPCTFETGWLPSHRRDGLNRAQVFTATVLSPSGRPGRV